MSLQISERLTHLLRRVNGKYGHFLHRHFLATSLTGAEVGSLELLRKYLRRLEARVEKLPYRPKISLIVPVYKVKHQFLKEMLQSVAAQVYRDWELCIVDDASKDPQIEAIIKDFATNHPGKVHFAINEHNSHISKTSNRCLSMARGDYVGLLDHDDRLLPNALAEMVRFINLKDRPDILYSDERIIDELGNHPYAPFCKPSWSPFLHLWVNYTTHFSVYRRSLVDEVGGFRAGYEGSQDHDLMLRATEITKKPVVHVPLTLYQWRASEDSTARNLSNKSYAADAGVRAVQDACERRGRPATVEWEPATLHYRVKFHLPKELPSISIVIPSKDNAKYLKPCLESIFEFSTYPNFDVWVVDNGSSAAETLAFLDEASKSYGGRCHVIRHDQPFNFAELNNVGIARSAGEYLVLLNDDTRVVSENWLEELLRFAQFPEVGAVGGKLLYEDDRIQHAGMVVLDRAIAGHSFRHDKAKTSFYMNFCHTAHETAGVTGACLMIARRKYEEVGGLDELYVPNGYGDVDFCLKLRARGYCHIYTPYAVLYHYESVTRGVEIETFERYHMIDRWGGALMNDPFLNFNFLRTESYHIDPQILTIDPTGSMFRALLEET